MAAHREVVITTRIAPHPDNAAVYRSVADSLRKAQDEGDARSVKSIEAMVSKQRAAMNQFQTHSASAATSVVASANQITKSFDRSLSGVMALTRGFVLMGVSGEKDVMRLVQSLLKMQMTFDILRGGIHTVMGLTKAWEAYEAAVKAATTATVAHSAALTGAAALGAKLRGDTGAFVAARMGVGGAGFAGAGVAAGAGAAALGTGAVVTAVLGLGATLVAILWAIKELRGAAAAGEKPDRKALAEEGPGLFARLRANQIGPSYGPDVPSASGAANAKLRRMSRQGERIAEAAALEDRATGRMDEERAKQYGMASLQWELERTRAARKGPGEAFNAAWSQVGRAGAMVQAARSSTDPTEKNALGDSLELYKQTLQSALGPAKEFQQVMKETGQNMVDKAKEALTLSQRRLEVERDKLGKRQDKLSEYYERAGAWSLEEKMRANIVNRRLASQGGAGFSGQELAAARKYASPAAEEYLQAEQQRRGARWAHQNVPGGIQAHERAVMGQQAERTLRAELQVKVDFSNFDRAQRSLTDQVSSNIRQMIHAIQEEIVATTIRRMKEDNAKGNAVYATQHNQAAG